MMLPTTLWTRRGRSPLPSAYQPLQPARRPAGKPIEKPTYRVLVHRKFANHWAQAVERVGLTGEVAAPFEVAQKVVDRLLGDVDLVGQLRGAKPVDGGMAEDTDVGGVQVVVPGREHAGVDLLPDPLPDAPQHGADVPASLGGIGWLGGFR